MTELTTPQRPPGQLSAEMQAELSRVIERMAGSKDLLDLPIAEARELDRKLNSFWNVDMPHMHEARRFVIPANPDLNAAACDAVVFRPHRLDASVETGRHSEAEQLNEGRILFVHGGGWCLCDLDTHERFMRVLAHTSQKEVVGIHYRLAPEHPFPAGLMDVISAYRALTESPEQFGLAPGPMVIAGDSAGANLALACMLHEIGEARAVPAGALLFYGAFGLDFSTESYRQYGDGYFLTQRGMDHFWRAYLPDAKTHTNPLAVPLLASDESLTVLPPMFLMAAELDPLASDTVELKARLNRLGRTDSLIVEPGVVHAFLQATKNVSAARKAVEAASNAARHFLAGAQA